MTMLSPVTAPIANYFGEFDDDRHVVVVAMCMYFVRSCASSHRVAEILEIQIRPTCSGKPCQHDLDLLPGFDEVHGPLFAEEQTPFDDLWQERGIGPAKIGSISLPHFNQSDQ